MATLPKITDLGSRPTPQPGAAVFSYNPGDGGMAEATALAQSGNQLVRTGEQQHLINQEEKKKADTLRAEEAFNALRQKQLDLTYGEKGFAQRKGADAVNAPLFKDYNALLDSDINAIAGTLQNQEQKALFLQRANVSKLQYGENILRHVAAERIPYQKQVYEGTLKTEARAAAAQWQDPNAIGTSLLRVEAAANTQADTMGLPKEGEGSEARRSMVEAAQAQIHGAVIGQMLANNDFVKAAEYFKENREAIDPNTAKLVQRAVEDGVQKQLSNGYRSAFVQARNNYQALQGLEAALNKDTRIDDTRKTALQSQISSRMDMLQRRANDMAERAERQMQRTIDNTTNLILKGYEPSLEQLLPMVTAAKGTPMEGEVQQLVQLTKATTAFRTATPTEQNDMRNQIAARVRKTPSANGVKILNAFDSIAANQRKEARENPYGFAVNMGLADPVQVDILKPDLDVDNLRQQVGVARGVAERYSVPFKPLQPDQVTQVTDFLKKANPTQQLDYFARLKAGTEFDNKAYNAIMGQIAPDSPGVALAGDYANRGRVKPASEILTGLQILNPNKKEDGTPAGGKLWPMPQGKDKQTMAQTFTDETSGALNIPEHRSAIEQAAMAIYAARSVKDGDDSGLLDMDRWRASIKDATGGVAKYNGKKTLLPYGMEPADFKSGTVKRINELAAMKMLPKGTTAERLKDLPLTAVGDGVYLLQNGDSYMVGANGKPLVIDFNLRVSEIGLEAPPTEAELEAAKKPYTGKARPRKAEK